MPFVPFLFANSSFRKLSRRFTMRMLGARRKRRVARIWFLKLLCERVEILALAIFGKFSMSTVG
jgi:hypothetical protein